MSKSDNTLTYVAFDVCDEQLSSLVALLKDQLHGSDGELPVLGQLVETAQTGLGVGRRSVGRGHEGAEVLGLVSPDDLDSGGVAVAFRPGDGAATPASGHHGVRGHRARPAT